MTTRRPRRTQAERRAEMREHILDQAEYLFSRDGLHGVAMRDVAERAGVHASLLHYYFDDKQGLFESVFARRVDISIGRRMAALEKYEAEAGESPTVEGALRAFLDTDFDTYIGGGAAWMNWGTFGARISNTPEGAELFDVYFDPLVLKLIGLLKRALPDVPEDRIFWGYHFVTGAFMHSLARAGRIDRLSGGLCKSDDFVSIKQWMARFMAAGFHALRDAPPPAPGEV
jgi:AcrR family transcriptional regulator